jgi:hypothetical protein
MKAFKSQIRHILLKDEPATLKLKSTYYDAFYKAYELEIEHKILEFWDEYRSDKTQESEQNPSHFSSN